jgi:aminopeptidase
LVKPIELITREVILSDLRHEKLAQILVDHSTQVKAGERVAIEAMLPAAPLVREIYKRVLEKGGYPHLLFHLPDEDETFFTYASDDQLDFTPTFQQLVTSEFDVYIRARSETHTRALTNIDPERQARWQKAMAPIRNMMMKRSAEKTMRWALTQYPTEAYAMEADMGLREYEDFVYQACHADADTPDPVAYWQGVEQEQARIVALIEGRDRVELKGPDVDIRLSIKGRKFRNASGQHNMPDGEIYTGPVEDSVNGWVRYTYPAVLMGRVVEGIELRFEQGKVVAATAEKNEEFLLKMINADEGARYVGEFAIGTNFQINRFTRNILFDEKIGGTFHMALGAGYPETGSRNTSAIHWDMICDISQDSEVLVDGEVFYRNGAFTA